jgi:flagellar biosynthesis protein FlhA
MAASVRTSAIGSVLKVIKNATNAKEFAVVLFVVIIMSIIIVPLPTIILDFLLTTSIAAAVLLLLIAFFTPVPTDFTTFPTLLLLVTLYRLALNVATTRMILTNGHEGPDAVSHLVAAFGEFVVGGNFVIGIIMFIILLIMNLKVVTSGSGRVAEVAARFTLDAMPGKQMAIDADLNAGMIDEPTARKRRSELLGEASFYGAMDGASKFVSGDAVAGMIITAINVIGGFLIGVLQHDLTISQSANNYTLLTIGDGLIAQLPALMISTSVGVLITRATKDDKDDDDQKPKTSFAENIINQLTADYKVLFTVGTVMLMFASIPGLPTLSLAFIGLCFMSLGWVMIKEKDSSFFSFLDRFIKKQPPAKKIEEEGSTQATAEPGQKGVTQKPKKSLEEVKKEEEEALADILKVEMLELNVGYGLIKLADSSQGGDLLERIRGMRRKIAQDFGFLMPQVRIRDNIHLPVNTYEILLKGVSIGSGEVYPEKFMAMDSGLVVDKVEGIPTKEPAFGLDAMWIDPSLKEEALMQGYTVVDPATVMATHMSELVKKYAEELLTRQDTQTLLDKLRKDYPKVVEDCEKMASMALIQKIFKQLLHEKVPIRDMLTIVETISDVAEFTKSVEIITEQVRARLARVITKQYLSDDNTLKLISFSTQSEQRMLDKLKDQAGNRTLLLNVGEISALVESVTKSAQEVLDKRVAPVIIIVDTLLRKNLSDIFERFDIDVVVLAHSEIEAGTKFEVLGTIDVNFP